MKTFFKKISEKIRTFFRALFEKIAGQDKLRYFDSVRFYILLSILTNFIVEVINRHSFKSAFVFMFVHFYVFLYNSLIIFLLFIPALFFRRKIFWTVFAFLWVLGFGIAGGVVTLCRVTPFSMIDILNLKSVLPIIPVYLNVFEIILFIALIAMGLALVVFLFIKMPKRKPTFVKGILTAVISAALVVSGFFFGTGTKMLSTNFKNLVDAYDQYGFEYCFAISIFDRGIEEPKDYSENSIYEIIDRIKSCDDSVPEEKPNIIFVQLESFFDVNNLNNVVFSENPVKNFTRYSSEGITGKVSVPVIGGGTVNTEFEVLTGLSLEFFGVGEYPYKTALSQYTCETVAYNLMEIGYSTHALHNYQGSFYRRNEVYKNLGFQSFTSMEYMSGIELNVGNVWPRDVILTDEILKILDSTTGTDFIFTVSVQPHGKYPPNSLPEDYEPAITAEFIDPLKEEGISDLAGLIYYVNQLSDTDLFVGELIEKIRAYDEKTVLVFYGDHLPSLSITNDDMDDSNIYQTPYLIVSNFGLEDQIDTLGDLNTYQFSAEVLKLLGIHNGNITKLHQNFSGKVNYKVWLYNLEYDMIGYDILGGISPRHIYGGKTDYYPKMEDMKMGTYPILIENCSYDEGILTVSGFNFTEYSKIVIGGIVIDETEFIDSATLRCPVIASRLLSGVRVSQISANGTELSSTDIFYPEIPEEK